MSSTTQAIDILAGDLSLSDDLSGNKRPLFCGFACATFHLSCRCFRRIVNQRCSCFSHHLRVEEFDWQSNRRLRNDRTFHSMSKTQWHWYFLVRHI